MGRSDRLFFLSFFFSPDVYSAIQAYELSLVRLFAFFDVVVLLVKKFYAHTHIHTRTRTRTQSLNIHTMITNTMINPYINYLKFYVEFECIDDASKYYLNEKQWEFSSFRFIFCRHRKLNRNYELNKIN